MHKYLIVLLTILFFGGCKDSSLQSYQTTEKITIDGKLDEWDSHPLQHFEEEHFSVSFLNSSSDIYLILATRDRQLMRIVQTSGIDIWVDTKKKKGKEYKIHYVGDIDSLDFTQMRNKMPTDNKAIDKNLKPPKHQKPGTILFSDYGNEYLIEKMKTTGPSAAVDIYKSVYLLEVRIPFADNDLFADIKEGKQKKINVGFALGEDISEMKKQRQGSPSGGGRGGGMGGGGRGGMRGGGQMGGPPGGSRPKMLGKIEKWFTVALAIKS